MMNYANSQSGFPVWISKGIISILLLLFGFDLFPQSFYDSISFVFTSQSYGNLLVGDYDKDQDYDILFASAYRDLVPDTLIVNQKDTFEKLDLSIVDVYGLGRGQAWGDIDNDNDLDLVVTGANAQGHPVSKIYRNEGMGKYVDVNANLEPVVESSAAFGDLDNDGDQDLVLSGLRIDGRPIAKIYYNFGKGEFIDEGIGLEGLAAGSILICDLDQDMDNDIVMNGYNAVQKQKTVVLRNDPYDEYTSLSDALPGIGWGIWKAVDLNKDGRLDLIGADASSGNLNIAIQKGSLLFEKHKTHISDEEFSRLDFGDYNNDGDVDVLVLSGGIYEIQVKEPSGVTVVASDVISVPLAPGDVAWVDWFNDYSNDMVLSSKLPNGSVLCEGKNTNSPPEMPRNLKVKMQDESTHLSWERPVDTETGTLSLSFNLRVGTRPGGTDILSPMSDSSGFHYTLDAGNCSLNSEWRLENLAPGVYYWSVQAIDHSHLGSFFTEEQSFSIPYTYKFTDLRVDSIDLINYLQPADFNNDGYFDYFCTAKTRVNDDSLISMGGVLWNQGDSIYVFENMNVLDGSNQVGDVSLSDYNNDGYVDISLTLFKDGDTSASIHTFYLLKNLGGTTFKKQQFDSVDMYCSRIHWLDFDQDGDLDLCLVGLLPDGKTKLDLYENIHGESFLNLNTPIVLNASNIRTALGDLNSDGRKELIILADAQSSLNELDPLPIVKVIQISRAGFSETSEIKIPPIRGMVDVSDYNNDGFMDLMEYGSSGEYEFGLQIYRNDGGREFVVIDPPVPGINRYGFSIWGDYNLDDQADIYIFQENLHQEAKEFRVYQKNGSRYMEKLLSVEGQVNFDSITEISSFNLLDLDGDSDLDMAICGVFAGDTLTGLFHQAGPADSTYKLTVPKNLVHLPGMDKVTLSWDHSQDGPFFYNVRVGTTPGGIDIVTPMADAETGLLRVPGLGNAECSNSFQLDSLPPGIYYWSVQAISRNRVGGAWAVEDSVIVGEMELDFEFDDACQGDTSTFMNRSIGEDSQWFWDFGDDSSSTVKNPSHVYQEAGEFEVILKSESKGFEFTCSKKIHIRKGLKVDFTFEQVAAGRDVPFENLTDTTGIEVMSWVWDFDDGSNFYGYGPVNHYYPNPNPYMVSLKALAVNGCADSIVKIINMCSILLEKPEIIAIGPNVWYLACSDNSADFYCWYLNGVEIPGATEAIYVPEEMGEYIVAISNQKKSCFVKSDPIKIPFYPTGIQKNNSFESLEVYPNPGNENITIQLNNPVVAELILDIYSVHGDKVLREIVQKNSFFLSINLNISELTPGFYILVLQLGGDGAQRKLLVE